MLSDLFGEYIGADEMMKGYLCFLERIIFMWRALRLGFDCLVSNLEDLVLDTPDAVEVSESADGRLDNVFRVLGLKIED